MGVYLPRYRIGSIVTARSVKLLNQKITLADRDSWWNDLREEIEQSALALDCSHVLGYTETTSFCTDIMIMSATGTAVKVIKSSCSHMGRGSGTQPREPTILERSKSQPPMPITHLRSKGLGVSPTQSMKTRKSQGKGRKCCEYLHKIVPPVSKLSNLHLEAFSSPEYNKAQREKLFLCQECNKEYVQDIILASIEPPEGLNMIGRPQLIQARTCKLLGSKEKGEQNVALSVSEKLFFVEYDLHEQLLSKMRIICMNALFAVKVKVKVTKYAILAYAIGTALRLSALPLSSTLQIKRDKSLYLSYHLPLALLTRKTIPFLHRSTPSISGMLSSSPYTK